MVVPGVVAAIGALDVALDVAFVLAAAAPPDGLLALSAAARAAPLRSLRPALAAPVARPTPMPAATTIALPKTTQVTMRRSQKLLAVSVSMPFTVRMLPQAVRLRLAAAMMTNVGARMWGLAVLHPSLPDDDIPARLGLPLATMK